MLIGLISDTHGLVRPECAMLFDGVDLILHAGDVGGLHVLHELEQIAPVQAVRGNIDSGELFGLPRRIESTLQGWSVHVSHGDELGSPTPTGLLFRYGADVIVFGHTHRALVHRQGRRLVVNPGSAGARRFQALPSVARLQIDHDRTDIEIIELAPR